MDLGFPAYDAVVSKRARRAVRRLLPSLGRNRPERFARAGLANEIHADYGRWAAVIPFPPEPLLRTTGPSSLERFLVVGDAWNQVVSRHLKPGALVLDVGCGCGKLARFLVSNPHVARYVGFDTIYENVEWCRVHIGQTAQAFEFLHFDLRSEAYNQDGRILPQEFVFPADDGAVDVVVAASLFTHLLEGSARRYLEETGRVLKPDGVAIVSIHTDPARGQHFSGDERRIDFDPDYFVSLGESAGLSVRESLGNLCGQEALVVELRR